MTVRSEEADVFLTHWRQRGVKATYPVQEERFPRKTIPPIAIFLHSTSDMLLDSLFNSIVIKWPHITSNMFIILPFLPKLDLIMDGENIESSLGRGEG